MEVQNNIFEEYYKKLMQITKKANDDNALLEILTKLNHLNYCEKIPFITTWTCTDLLLHLISLLKDYGKEEPYLALLCDLIVKVASKQKVVICSMSVNVILHGLKDTWFEILAYYNVTNSSKEVCSYLLNAIAAVVYGNGAYIMPDILNWLTGKDRKNGSIGELLSAAAIDLKIQCLQCLSGLCIASESRASLDDDYLHHCLQLFIQMLQNIPPVKDVSHYRAIFAAHKGLQYILEGPSGIHLDEIGPLLAVFKKHLVFGLSAPAHELPDVLTPMPLPPVITPNAISTASRDGFGSAKKKKKRNRRKNAQDRGARTDRTNQDEKDAPQSSNVPNESESKTTFSLQSSPEKSNGSKLSVTSSESEYSDTEGGQLSAMNSFAFKIRHMTIASLYSIVKKTSKVIMLGYWNSFISSSLSPKDISLLSCIVNDPAPKARLSALMALSALLEGSKVFLSLGIQKGDSSAFVSFSSTLTSYVYNIHNTLLNSLTKERSTLVQIHILKTLSILASNTPYSKLSTGLITDIFAKVRAAMVICHMDTKIGVLNVYSALVAHDPTLPEVKSCITNLTKVPTETTEIAQSQNSMNSASTTLKSWLVEDCLTLLGKSANLPLPLHVAVFQLLSSVIKMYFCIIVEEYFMEIVPHICVFICDTNPTIRLHASKLAEEFGASLLKSQQNDSKSRVEKGLMFWKELLSGAMQKVVESIDDAVSKSCMCNCLATIGASVLEKLPERQQLYCQTLLLGLTSDESYLVRSAAIRALARYIMYPFLRRDIGFIEDVARCILLLMQDPIKTVQFNAAWSFGNFTDSIIINVENESQSFSRDMLRKSFLLDMLQCAVDSFDRKEKVRFNIMRVLGNILRFCNETHFSDERFRTSVMQAKTIMVSAALHDSLMKVRWNACLACGNMLRNAHLPVGEPEWTDDVYWALTTAVSSSKNYKVSIKAAIALGCPLSREAYGSNFSSIYLCVLGSLKNSEINEVDIGQYKFKDQLQNQLICTLLHLTTFVLPSDIQPITIAIADKQLFEFVKSKVNKWYNALFIDHKLSSLSLDELNTDAYAALGQYTFNQKKDLYQIASTHWGLALKSALDVPCKEDRISTVAAAQYKELFSSEA